MDKDPTTWSAATWILVSCTGLAAGLINWYMKHSQGKARPINVLELIGELFVSSIITLGVYMALESYYPIGVSIAVAGGCGHMGTRFIYVFELIVESRLRELVATTTSTTSVINNLDSTSKDSDKG